MFNYHKYLRRSQYCRRISNSFKTLASRLQCLSVGCACTILWRQRAALARTCREGRGRFGLRWSRCRSWTRRGIHLLDLIISQLVGLEDIARRVLDIFSTSVHPAVHYSLIKYTYKQTHCSLLQFKQVYSEVQYSLNKFTYIQTPYSTVQYSTVQFKQVYSTVQLQQVLLEVLWNIKHSICAVYTDPFQLISRFSSYCLLVKQD